MANWFRFYDDAVNDPKIIELPDDLYRAWVNVLCVAAKNDGVLPAMKHVAVVLRVKPGKAAALITRLVAAGLVDNHNGVFAPHNWQGRQFKSDDSGPRVKKHRDKLRNAKSNDGCNVTSVDDSNAPEGEEKKIEGEQSRADAGAPIDEEFGSKVAAVSISIRLSFTTRGFPAPSLDRVPLWLQQGYTSATILGAIDRVLKRGKGISTLDYFDAAIREDHAKAPPAAVGPQIVSIQEFIVEGTVEWSAWNQYLRETTGRGSPVTDNRDERGVLRRGWFRPTNVPPGYDEATGEKLAPSDDEAAA